MVKSKIFDGNILQAARAEDELCQYENDPAERVWLLYLIEFENRVKSAATLMAFLYPLFPVDTAATVALVVTGSPGNMTGPRCGS
ncbi:hypothetical protein SAY87_031463 [Trapa incisa]|uniref:Uncharacterized protein n=1 Tax=Trapa incisa TaxID=236973 RepID=A0AAN7KX74_9MYRT|nr:hypothetical protein SAY87_031463 [Trapa incisa]